MPDEPFEDVLHRFQRGGLEFAMTSPAVKKGKKVSAGSPSKRQSPRTLANMEYIENSSSETESQGEQLQEEVEVTIAYFPPRKEGAPDIVVPKGFKYELILPPLDKRVKEEGNLWGNMQTIKFADYNLVDYKLYPHFRRDRYMTIQRNPRTKRDEFVPMEHASHLSASGLLNLLEIPHFG